MNMIRKLAVAAVATGGLLVAAAPAQAGGHVSLSIGVPVVSYGYAAPAYYGPPPVAYAPAPVYAPAPYYGRGYYGPRYYDRGYYGPRVVYRPAPGYYGHGRHDHGGWHR